MQRASSALSEPQRSRAVEKASSVSVSDLPSRAGCHSAGFSIRVQMLLEIQ